MQIEIAWNTSRSTFEVTLNDFAIGTVWLDHELRHPYCFECLQSDSNEHLDPRANNDGPSVFGNDNKSSSSLPLQVFTLLFIWEFWKDFLSANLKFSTEYRRAFVKQIKRISEWISRRNDIDAYEAWTSDSQRQLKGKAPSSLKL